MYVCMCFRGLPFNVERAPSCLKHINSRICIYMCVCVIYKALCFDVAQGRM